MKRWIGALAVFGASACYGGGAAEAGPPRDARSLASTATQPSAAQAQAQAVLASARPLAVVASRPRIEPCLGEAFDPWHVAPRTCPDALDPWVLGEDPGTARQQASEHFKKGVALFHDGSYREALDAFERAHDTAPDYRLLYNIGLLRALLADHVGAAEALEKYTLQGAGDVPQQRRDEVATELAALEPHIGRISVSANEEGAEVYVDDAPIGRTPLRRAAATTIGRHRVLVRSTSGATEVRTFEVAGGDVAKIAITFVTPALAAQTEDRSKRR